MGLNIGKALGGAAGLAAFIPGGQAFAGVLGAAATAFAEPEGVVYLSPYLDATIPAPFGFPSAPAALTPRPEAPTTKVAAKGGIISALAAGGLASGPPPSQAKALHTLKSAERAPYAPPPGKPNMAGLLRAHAKALREHPQYLGGTAVKWVDQDGWLDRVARLRVGIQLDAEGRDPAWAFYDDPPNKLPLALDPKRTSGLPYGTLDFAPPATLAGPFSNLLSKQLVNMAGVPWEKLPAHVDKNLERAREYFTEERARLWEEVQAQQEFDAMLRAVEEQYREHVRQALANGVQLVSPEAFLNPNSYTPAVTPSLAVATAGTKARPAEAHTGRGALTLAAILAILAVL